MQGSKGTTRDRDERLKQHKRDGQRENWKIGETGQLKKSEIANEERENNRQKKQAEPEKAMGG